MFITQTVKMSLTDSPCLLHEAGKMSFTVSPCLLHEMGKVILSSFLLHETCEIFLAVSSCLLHATGKLSLTVSPCLLHETGKISFCYTRQVRSFLLFLHVCCTLVGTYVNCFNCAIVCIL